MQLNKISTIGKGLITTYVWTKLVLYKFLDTGVSIAELSLLGVLGVL